MPHRILSLSQAAKRIRVPERELAHLAQRHEIPHQRRGDEPVFEKRLLDEWAQRRILNLAAGPLADHHRVAVAERQARPSDDTLIESLLRPDWIRPALSAKTKPSLLREMAALAVSTGLLFDEASFLEALEERERASSTALGGGVALLHARFHDPYHAEASFLVLGRSRTPLFFGAEDGATTDLFFLLYCTDDAGHLHALARLCILAQRPGLLDSLRAAEDAASMYRLLADAEVALLRQL